jgi:hypothetical protein
MPGTMSVDYVKIYLWRIDNGMAHVIKCVVATGCVAAMRAGHMYKSSFSNDVIAWVALWYFIPGGDNVQV